jgi:hypothetical protein
VTAGLLLAAAALPGEFAMPTEQLRDAIMGLAGITGFLLFPMLGAWMRLLLQYLERGRPGITRARPVSGLGFVRAVATTGMLMFFMFTMLRAASDLREIHAEAPVFGSALQGVAVGVCIWAIYALGISALMRATKNRLRGERRMGSLR